MIRRRAEGGHTYAAPGGPGRESARAQRGYERAHRRERDPGRKTARWSIHCRRTFFLFGGTKKKTESMRGEAVRSRFRADEACRSPTTKIRSTHSRRLLALVRLRLASSSGSDQQSLLVWVDLLNGSINAVSVVPNGLTSHVLLKF